MFINIATENIILYDRENSYVIPFRDVEQELTRICINSYKTYLPGSIYVLNGPWSFTNLRVWSLVINILLLLSQEKCTVYTIDKLSLYRFAVIEWFLPPYGYIFMWQRKNIRYYDFEQDNYTVYSKSELSTITSNFQNSQDENFFIDLFVWQDFAEFFAWNSRMIDIVYRDEEVILSFLWKEYKSTHLFSPTQKMEPYYAMEPNIG
jgi:hypothetical protein